MAAQLPEDAEVIRGILEWDIQYGRFYPRMALPDGLGRFPADLRRLRCGEQINPVERTRRHHRQHRPCAHFPGCPRWSKGVVETGE